MPQVFSTSPVVSAARSLYHSNYRLAFFFTAVFLLLSSSGQAQSFQEPGFTSELVTTMPQYKTVGLTFAPDGRMFLWQDDGIVRIFKNGTLLPTPFLDISNRVNYLGDRGLMGLAFDPNFSTTGFIYLYYTYEPGNDPQNYDARTQRLTRMKVSATNPDVADPGSEIVILGQIGVAPCGQYPEGSDCIGADIDSHVGGTIRFAPDGKLFLSTGDAASYNFADERALRAQNLNLYEGKILRINPDGSAPTDNPFYDGTNSVRSRIYSYGLRNPFRMALHPVTGEPYIGEVGWYSFEEINRGRGANFGWPCFEGNFPQSDYQRLFSACQALPATAVTQPLHTYGHDTGQAVIGGTFYTGTQYPSAYHHNFFFADYPSNWIRRMVLNADGTVASVQMFASNVSNPVGVEQGPDGSLYYISIVSGEVRRIRYATSAPPIAAASASPVSGSSPLTVSFSSAGSSDPNGAPLSWQWNFGDGTSSTQANPTHTYTASTNSTFTASLVVSSTSGTSLPATVNITVNAAQANRPPVATIITPSPGAAFAPGSVVNYQASATDPDETLPASAYKWNVILHHDDHVHPQLESTGPSGSFTAEAHANGTYFYELVLTVTDSGGLSDTRRLNLAPVTQSNGQLPVPWSTADVGATQPGSATFASNVFTVRGGGPDIWGDLDGFHFTHQQVAGDFTFTARVVSLENTDYWAKAGLMIRENLSAGSRNVGNFVNPEAGTYFQFRNATGGFTDEIFTSRLRPALWMRLVRREDIIEAWQSVDGANWERVTSQTTMLPGTVYIGLAVSSHSTTALATATFENVSVIR
jgi:glucose/arabinose dehydrogenase/regulation of enolase protein 1 (concanavalin A-like superfamily)